jgi:hypothetical protein
MFCDLKLEAIEFFDLQPGTFWINVICGSGSTPDRLKYASVGPVARMSKVRDVVPPKTKPPIKVLAPVPTKALAEIFERYGLNAL